MNQLQIPAIRRRESAATKTALGREEREALYQMTQMPGYRVFLRLMEMKCVLQDAALMSVDCADEKRVLAEHRITTAKWEFFDDVQKQVGHECNELMAPPQAPNDPVQQELDNILDPTRPAPGQE